MLLTTAAHDVLLLGGLLLSASGGVALAGVVLPRRTRRPCLPEPDRPPAGLGRLVPVGAQVEAECREAAVRLEQWLAALSRRQEGAGEAPR